MASKTARTALLLMLNLLFFTVVASATQCPPPPHKSPKPTPSYNPSPPKPTPSHNPSPPKPTPSPTPAKGSCPKDTLKLGVCGKVLQSLLNVALGTPPTTSCCSLIQGLVDLDAAACLCTAIKANVLGINLNVPVSLSLLLNYCGKKVPSGFQCS